MIRPKVLLVRKPTGCAANPAMHTFSCAIPWQFRPSGSRMKPSKQRQWTATPVSMHSWWHGLLVSHRLRTTVPAHRHQTTMTTPRQCHSHGNAVITYRPTIPYGRTQRQLTCSLPTTTNYRHSVWIRAVGLTLINSVYKIKISHLTESNRFNVGLYAPHLQTPRSVTEQIDQTSHQPTVLVPLLCLDALELTDCFRNFHVSF